MAAVAGPQTPQRPLPGGFINTPAPAPSFFAPQAASLRQNNPPPAPSHNQNAADTTSTAPSISPVERAARTINDTLAHESRFPDLESVVSQGMSGEYELPAPTSAWQPYQKLRMYDLPPAIIEQANQTVGGLQMGVMPVLGHCWAIMDNCLYLWDYTVPNPELIGYEENAAPITAVKLIKPKPGVFVKEIEHLLVVATSDTMLLLGVAQPVTATGAKTVALYNTKMWIHTKGLNVREIAASAKTGRIFFLDGASEDIYEFQYQQEEGWFRGKCMRICHTRSNYDFVPAPVKAVGQYFGPGPRTKTLRRLVLDDTRDLLYTLSDSSEIKVWLVKEQVKHALSRPLASLLQNTGHFTGRTDLLYAQDVHVVDLSTIPATEASKLSVVAITNTGCRLYLSATRGYGGQADAMNAPSSMQILHIRFPPRDPSTPQQQPSGGATQTYASGPQSNIDTASKFLTPTNAAHRIPPGYFLAFQPDQQGARERVFCSAVDSARLKNPQDATALSSRFVEFGQWIDLPSPHSDLALVTPNITATSTPLGFANELAIQFDHPSAELAIMTASGVQTLRRRRLVDIFASMMRNSSSDDEGRDGDIKRFIRTYGRGETAATALAVACGQGVDVASDSRITAVTDAEVIEGARKVFIEQGGKAEYNANAVVERSGEGAIESVRPSPRFEGLALYISRLVRSLWSVKILRQAAARPGEVTAVLGPGVSAEGLRKVQRDLNTLSDFLNRNKSFIDGLAGPPSQAMGRPSTRQEEIALHGEHRAMSSLVQLISNIIEGISFALVLFDESLSDILAALGDESRQRVRDLTFEQLFVSTTGKDLAKELVKAIVNRNIANGSNVDTVAEALRKRCGSFCSTDDVIVFKAQELLKRASVAGGETEGGRVQLNESARLFGKVAATLTQENLTQAVRQFVEMKFYAGAVQLCLAVAKARDPGRQAASWMRDGMPDSDARKSVFERRRVCYDLVFEIIRALDASTANLPDQMDGQATLAARRRSEAYDLIDSSDDTVFLTCLYDWYIANSQADRLLDNDTPFVVQYLQRRAQDERLHADLLWRYYAHHNDFLRAAATQLDLAKGYFALRLEERIAYLSRARTNASTRSTALLDARQSKHALLREISNLLDVATIQDDILQRIKSDPRLTGSRRDTVIENLDSEGIHSVSDLFNQFSDQAGYYDLNLLLFQIADHRSPADISANWSGLIQSEIDRARAARTAPYERVGATVLEMGRRLDRDAALFPIGWLVRELEKFAIEPQEFPPPAHWVIEVLLSAGVPPEELIPELERLYYGGEHPFVGSKRRIVAGDMVEVCEKWVRDSENSGEGLCGGDEGRGVVREVLGALVRERGLHEEGKVRAEGLLRVLDLA
jgi:nuclear pore complex protein Nup155